MTTTFFVGLPDIWEGPYLDTARCGQTPIMVSARAFWRRQGASPPRFRVPATRAVLALRGIALDSAGYTAARQGSYPWSVTAYVEFVVQWIVALDAPVNPFAFWSSMDYCVEPDIARSLEARRERIGRTAETLGEILEEVDYWRLTEGFSELQDPLPVLQGWEAADYARSFDLTRATLAAHGRDVPPLLGIGSVCRRSPAGPHGVLAILEELDQLLPKDTRLHLFGVHSGALDTINADYAHRVASTDSMAWSRTARIAQWGSPRSREKDSAFLSRFLTRMQRR